MDVSRRQIFSRYGAKIYTENHYRDQWHGPTYEARNCPTASITMSSNFTANRNRQAGFTSIRAIDQIDLSHFWNKFPTIGTGVVFPETAVNMP